MTRIASTPFYADGTVVAGWSGWGALGATVPSTGADGPALAYPTLLPLLPGAAGSEVRIELLTFPASGAFTWYDDTSASLVSASAGAWTASFRVWVGEVDQGVATAYFYVGATVATLAGALASMSGDVLVGATRAEAALLGTLDGLAGNLVVGTFTFGPPQRRYTLPQTVRRVGSTKL